MITEVLDTMSLGQILDLLAQLEFDLKMGIYYPSKKNDLKDKISNIKAYLKTKGI